MLCFRSSLFKNSLSSSLPYPVKRRTENDCKVVAEGSKSGCQLKKVLIFPAGSEVAFEVFESIRYSPHFKVIGANSIQDHSSFIFPVLFKLPYLHDFNFLSELRDLIKNENVDYLYPTMDEVALLLKSNEDFLTVKVIGSSLESYSIANNKEKTYNFFKDILKVPKIYTKKEAVDFPLFLKPKSGYGSRGVMKINSVEELNFHFKDSINQMLIEYLPEEEFTIDCFTNKDRELLYCSPRTRERIRMGISVHSKFASNEIFEEVKTMAEIINSNLKIRFAWFFQVKRGNDGKLALLEIGLRPAGSSGLNRLRDVNLPLLSLFEMDGYPIQIKCNYIKGRIDRAFSTKAKIDLNFNQLFIDFDDCILINNKLNPKAIELIIHCRNEKKSVILISKHNGDLKYRLNKLKIEMLFDRVIHLKQNQSKKDYLLPNSLFVDDSFSERKNAATVQKVITFGVESIDLINSNFL